MTYSHDPDFAHLVVYLVDNTVVPNADAPVAVRTGEFPAAVRTRVVGQGSKRAPHTPENRGVETPQAAFSGGFEKDGVHGESTAARRGR